MRVEWNTRRIWVTFPQFRWESALERLRLVEPVCALAGPPEQAVHDGALTSSRSLSIPRIRDSGFARQTSMILGLEQLRNVVVRVRKSGEPASYVVDHVRRPRVIAILIHQSVCP